VKSVLSALYFRLFVHVFVLKKENKRAKEKTLTNKADFKCQFSVVSLNSCCK
jgi:hypothetical protein